MQKVKKILHGDEARQKVKEGIDLVAMIKQTLGPKGRNILLSKLGPLPPRIVNDGTTIANEIDSKDPFVKAGVRMVQEVCKKTNDVAGDGTTTTALLTQEIVKEGNKWLVAGRSPIDLKQELEKDLKVVLNELENISTPIETNEQIEHIATIASNNDEEVGKAISSITNQVGRNASIMVEKSVESEIRTTMHKGIFFHKGFVAEAFINKFEHYKAELSDVFVCVTDKDLQWASEIDDFFKKVADQSLDKILIIAPKIEGEALNSLCITNKRMLTEGDGLHLIAVEAPEFGPTRQEILEDICVMTGAKLISDKTGFTFRDSDPAEVLGGCNKVMSDSKTTTILPTILDKEDSEIKGGLKKEIDKRIKDLKSQIEQLAVTEKTTKEKLDARLMVMEAGVGILHAGGPTEIEAKERYLRLEDAILAVRSSCKDGFVAGGGHTYLKLSKVAETAILKEALKSVIKQVAENAGKNPETIIEKVELGGKGWNAKTDKFVDLIKDGVLDATLVVKEAIKNAVSVGSYFLTMTSVITEDLESDGEEKK